MVKERLAHIGDGVAAGGVHDAGAVAHAQGAHGGADHHGDEEVREGGGVAHVDLVYGLRHEHGQGQRTDGVCHHQEQGKVTVHKW